MAATLNKLRSFLLKTPTGGTNGQALIKDSAQAGGLAWGPGIPTQTSQAGKFLTTDGTTASWDVVPSALPSAFTCRLQWNNTTNINLVPHNGGQVIIGGVPRQLPVSGTSTASMASILAFMADGLHAVFVYWTGSAFGIQFAHASSATIERTTYGYWVLGSDPGKTFVGAVMVTSNLFEFPNNGSGGIAVPTISALAGEDFQDNTTNGWKHPVRPLASYYNNDTTFVGENTKTLASGSTTTVNASLIVNNVYSAVLAIEFDSLSYDTTAEVGPTTATKPTLTGSGTATMRVQRLVFTNGDTSIAYQNPDGAVTVRPDFIDSTQTGQVKRHTLLTDGGPTLAPVRVVAYLNTVIHPAASSTLTFGTGTGFTIRTKPRG